MNKICLDNRFCHHLKINSDGLKKCLLHIKSIDESIFFQRICPKGFWKKIEGKYYSEVIVMPKR